jgi:hypothetical protein
LAIYWYFGYFGYFGDLMYETSIYKSGM